MIIYFECTLSIHLNMIRLKCENYYNIAYLRLGGHESHFMQGIVVSLSLCVCVCCRELSLFQRQICTSFHVFGTADSVLIREVPFIRSVLYREVPRYSIFLVVLVKSLSVFCVWLLKLSRNSTQDQCKIEYFLLTFNVHVQVVLQEGQSLEDGRAIAEELMVSLGVANDQLLCGAYMDMLLEGQSMPSESQRGTLTSQAPSTMH